MRGLVLLMLVGVALPAARATAQELEPGAYSVSPVGLTALTVGYTLNTGDVNFDPSLPVEQASATIHSGSMSLGRSVNLFGRSATALVALPFIDGHVEGLYAGQPASADRTGLGDLRLRLGVNLYGSPARKLPEFAKTPPAKTNIGASITVLAPTGQYDPARVINLGLNRWAFRPQAAIVRNRGPWMFEIYGGVWLFMDNDNYANGHVRSQEPLGEVQFSARRTFRPGFWISGNANFYSGGRTHLDDVAKQDFQSNSRVGATLSWPLSPKNALRVAVSRGAYTTIGADFLGVSVSFQQLF